MIEVMNLLRGLSRMRELSLGVGFLVGVNLLWVLDLVV